MRTYVALFLTAMAVQMTWAQPEVPEARSGFRLPKVRSPRDNTECQNPNANGYGYLCEAIYSCGTLYHPGHDWNDDVTESDAYTPVLAVADGIVRDASERDADHRFLRTVIEGGQPRSRWGSYVIEHSYNGVTWYSQYGHMYKGFVNEGWTVRKGEIIGLVGDVGSPGAFHLHWEIRESDHLQAQNAQFFCNWLVGATQEQVEERYENPLNFIAAHGAYGDPVAVGEGAELSTHAESFLQRYSQLGGEAALGQPLSHVFREDNGQIQLFNRTIDESECAIVLPDAAPSAYYISGAIYVKWRSLGRGWFQELGYPVGDEGIASPSSPYYCCGNPNTHTTGTYVAFWNGQTQSLGTINYISGPECNPLRGKAFAVHGSNYAYFSSHNYAGWAGFPVSDVYSWNDGFRTDLEGGYIFTVNGQSSYTDFAGPRDLNVASAFRRVTLRWRLPSCIPTQIQLRRSAPSLALDDTVIVAALGGQDTTFVDSTPLPGITYRYDLIALADTFASPPSAPAYALLREDSLQFDLVSAEYFFDSDPGPGSGEPITVFPDDNVSLVSTIELTSHQLSVGPHRLYLRYRDTRGIWSAAEGRSLYVTPAIPSGNLVVNQAEAFFDNDPGLGNGEWIPVSAADDVTLTSTLAHDALNPGFHRMYLRYKANSDAWSAAEGRSIYITPPVPAGDQQITSAEYFYDSDPGNGAGNPLNITPDASVTLVSAISPSLSTDFHRLFLRYQTLAGTWSAPEGRSFYVTPDAGDSIIIASGELFFDSVGAYDSGLVMTADDSTFDESMEDLNRNVPAITFSAGQHYVFARVRDNRGLWSNTVRDSFFVGVPENIELVVKPIGLGQQVRLVWTSFPGTTEYQVHYDSLATGQFLDYVSATPPDTFLTVNTVPGVGRRFYQIVAILPSRVARSNHSTPPGLTNSKATLAPKNGR